MVNPQDVHCLVKCRPFPNLMMLSKKDSLWKAVRSKANGAVEEQGKNIEAHAWSFLAPTLLLPQDRTAFLKLLSDEPMTSLWIAKPSSANRGNGIRLVNKNSDLEELVLTTDSVCMQRYLGDPYLLPSRLKFDLRVYVLITSWDPIRIYMYRVRACGWSCPGWPGEVLHARVLQLPVHHHRPVGGRGGPWPGVGTSPTQR